MAIFAKTFEAEFDITKKAGSSLELQALSIPSDATDQDVIDIRNFQVKHTSLASKCVDGLSQPFGCKFLPSILLWDNKGQKLYNEILHTSHYYPFNVEYNLLKVTAPNLARNIISSGTQLLVELGAGTLRKTALVLKALDALQSPLVYYALDVDEKELKEGLLRLKSRTNFNNIIVRGLLGTYEDGARWLAAAQDAQGKRQLLLWLGNSIANLQPCEASQLLRAFTANYSNESFAGIILGIDGCTNEATIKSAYDTPGGETRRWIKHALEAGRNCLGSDATDLLGDGNWTAVLEWHAGTRRFENYVQATKTLYHELNGHRVCVERGERIHVLGSGKWNIQDVARLAAEHGLELGSHWNNPNPNYGW